MQTAEEIQGFFMPKKFNKFLKNAIIGLGMKTLEPTQ